MIKTCLKEEKRVAKEKLHTGELNRGGEALAGGRRLPCSALGLEYCQQSAFKRASTCWAKKPALTSDQERRRMDWGETTLSRKLMAVL